MSQDLERGLFSAVIAVAAGLELSATLRRIVQAAVSLVDAQYGALGIVGSDGRVSDFVHVGVDQPTAATIGPLPSGKGILGLLIDHPVPIRLDHLNEHRRSFGFPPGHPPMESFLGVPVRVRGEVFGNLYLTEKRGGGGFSSEDERTVTALAAAAGVAIENARLYDRAKQRERWQHAVAEIVNNVLVGADTGDVLAKAASMARELTDCDVALVALVSEGRGPVVEIVDKATPRVADARSRWSVHLSQKTSAGHLIGEDFGDVIGAELEQGSAMYASFADAEVIRLDGFEIGSHRAGPTLLVPLSAPGQNMGCLALIRELQSPGFTAESLELAQTFATQVAVSLVVAEARREGERLAIYEERDRIARDLHDLVIQRLFATGMMLSGAARIPDVPEAVAVRVGRAIDDLDATIREIRHTIFVLNEPEEGEPTTLRGRVLREVRTASSLLGFEPHLQFDGPVDSALAHGTADDVVAVARESLANVAKHAGATRVDVLVAVRDHVVTLTIEDNGVGLGLVTRRSGLANLRSRAESRGGAFETEQVSEHGGTRVRWTVPLDRG